MASHISPSAVALPTPAQPGTGPSRSRGEAAGSTSSLTVRAPASVMPAGGEWLSGAPRRLGSVLGDLGGILALVYTLPLVILVIGIPIALLIRLGMWIVGTL